MKINPDLTIPGNGRRWNVLKLSKQINIKLNPAEIKINLNVNSQLAIKVIVGNTNQYLLSKQA